MAKSPRIAADSCVVNAPARVTSVMVVSPRASGLDLDEPVVALVLQAVGELTPTLLDDLAIDEDVDEVGLDVAQYPGVVRDQQDTDVTAGRNAVDAFGDHLERVDVEPGVGLVQDGQLRVQQLHLEDLVSLLLATGETLVDVALGKCRVHPQLGHGRLHVLDPGAQLGSLAVDRGLGGTQEVGHRDARHLDGVLHGQEQAGAGALVNPHGQDVLAVQGHGATGDGVLRVAGDAVGQGRLAGAVGPHDGVGLPRLHGQVDAAQDLLDAVLRVDRDMQVVNLQCCHGLSVLLRHGDEHVATVDLHGIDSNGGDGRWAGGLPGAQVEARAMQPALDSTVLDVALGQGDVGMAAGVVDRVDVACAVTNDGDLLVVDLNLDSTHSRQVVDRADTDVSVCHCLLYTSPSPRDGLLSR